MANLYELTEGLLAIQEMLQDPLEDEQILLDTLEAVEGEYKGKMEGYCKVIRNLEYDAENLKTEAKRLSDKRRVIEANIDRLKKAMFDSMKAIGTNKVKGSIFTVAIQKNGGKAPVIVDVPTHELPDELVKVVESPDLDAMYNILTTHGTSKYCHLGEKGESLRIK